MKKISLSEYAKNKSQAEVAREIGVSREAVSQMLVSEREIYVGLDEKGAVSAWERRPVPARKSTAA